MKYWREIITGALLSTLVFGVFSLQSGEISVGGSTNTIYSDRLMTLAEKQILDTYGDRVSVQSKNKTLRKFGRNTAVAGTYETVWRTGGNETIPSTNAVTHISSGDNGDTQDVVVEGHTIADNRLTFVVQTVTLTGQASTTLSTPLRDVTRIYNNDTTDFAGTVYVYEEDTVTAGVPQTASKIHMSVVEGNQSEKAATAISDSDYYIATGVQCFVFTKTAETVEFTGEFRQIDYTNGAKAWRRIYNTVASNDSAYTERFDPPLIIPRNSDLRMRAKSDGTSVDVGCSVDGYLALVLE